MTKSTHQNDFPTHTVFHLLRALRIYLIDYCLISWFKLQSAAGDLLCNLTADLEPSRAAEFAKWLDPERIYNLMKITLQDSWECLEDGETERPFLPSPETNHTVRSSDVRGVDSPKDESGPSQSISMELEATQSEIVSESEEDRKEVQETVSEYSRNRFLANILFGILGNLISVGKPSSWDLLSSHSSPSLSCYWTTCKRASIGLAD